MAGSVGLSPLFKRLQADDEQRQQGKSTKRDGSMSFETAEI
jgi:hypothetical protein